MVSVDIEIAFVGDDKNIRLPKTEFLLCAAVGKLVKSKKLRDWTSRNVVLLPPFLTEIVIINEETTSEALFNISTERINRQEAENATEESDADEDSRFDKDNKK